MDHERILLHLLVCSASNGVDRLKATDHFRFLDEVLGYADKQWDNFYFIIADSSNANNFIVLKEELPLLGCSKHFYDFPVSGSLTKAG